MVDLKFKLGGSRIFANSSQSYWGSLKEEKYDCQECFLALRSGGQQAFSEWRKSDCLLDRSLFRL